MALCANEMHFEIAESGHWIFQSYLRFLGRKLRQASFEQIVIQMDSLHDRISERNLLSQWNQMTLAIRLPATNGLPPRKPDDCSSRYIKGPMR